MLVVILYFQFAFSSSAYYLLVILSAIQLPFINFSMLGLIILRYEKRTYFYLPSNIESRIAIVIRIRFVVFMDGGLEWVLICQLLTLVLTSIVLYTNIKQYLLFSFSWKISWWALVMLCLSFLLVWEVWWWFIPIGSLWCFFNNINNRLVFFFFKVGLWRANLGNSFYDGLASFYVSTVCKGKPPVAFAKFMPLVSCFLFLLVSVLSLLSEDIVSIVAGPDFFIHINILAVCRYILLWQ